ncbi:hypothetical protein POG22_01770 [Geitlerinema sp. CS-897]|nr:hypothetical protein [Geitlerinema sp. CS-897]
MSLDLRTSLVDIASITSTTPRSTFSESKLETVARSILKSGGLVKPIIIKRIGLDSYQIVAGDFEYYASLKAQEIDDNFEMIRAFIVDSEQESFVVEQASEIAKQYEIKAISVPSSEGSSELESRLSNLELRLEQSLNDIRREVSQERTQIFERFQGLESQISEPIDPLHELNVLPYDKIAIRLKQAKIARAEKLAKTICEARSKKSDGQFENYLDVVESVKGLGQKTILSIIDDWSSRR